MNTWTKWTAGRKISAIQSVWQRGMSTDEIAKAISDKYEIAVGRNAVIGFYHRTSSNSKDKRGANLLKDYPLLKPSGLTDAQRESRREAEKRRQIKRRERIAGQRKVAIPAQVQGRVLESQPFDDLPIEGYGVPLLKLSTRGCRWPTSVTLKGATLFCNHKAHKHNYCEGHYKRSRYAVS